MPRDGSGPPPRHRHPLLIAALLLLSAPAAGAGEATAESIWSRSDARQRALQQVPAGATTGRARCREIGMAGNDVRYRCTIPYTTAPADAPAADSVPQPQPPDRTP
jgi:hypothetical protein